MSTFAFIQPCCFPVRLSIYRHSASPITPSTRRTLARPIPSPHTTPSTHTSNRNAATRAPRASLLTTAAALLPLASASTESVSPALQAAKLVAGPGINLFNFVMIIRIILTWYPKTDLAKVPWIFIAVPTEPLLRATRKVIQPVGGVDISPIVWFAIMSFVHEILVGPQGILVLMSQK